MGNVDVKNLVLSGKGIVTGKGAISFLETLNYKRVIIVTGGKQYRVAEGDVIFVEKLDVAAGESVTTTATHVVTEDDVKNGNALYHGIPPDLS